MCIAIFAPATFLGLALFAHHPLRHALYGLLAGAIVILAHRPNIVRLLASNERRLSY